MGARLAWPAPQEPERARKLALRKALDAVALPNAEPVPVKAPKKTVTTSATSSGVRRAKRGSRRFRKPQQ